MNSDAFNRKRRAVRAAAAVFMSIAVSAVFGAAWAQDGYDDGEAVELSAPAQSEASGETAAPAQHTTDGPAPVPAPAIAADGGDSASGANENDGGGEAGDNKRAAADKAGGKSAPPVPIFSKPNFELGLGMATVEGKRWVRADLGVEFAIWRFGFFFDFELFLDNKWRLSDKSWDFKDNTAEAVLRKIRYVRYGQENEPLFVKFGGLSDVTLGYGMIVDGFTNMLRFPDEKLLGLQLYVNDISPIGLTVQTLISDFEEAGDGGGVYAARIAARPLKTSELFLLDGLSAGVMYAVDANVQAPVRKWAIDNSAGDSILLDSLRNSTRSFALWGIDVGLPLVNTELFGLDLYGQSAFRADGVSGWGIGVPGLALRLWRLSGNVEYRTVGGRFTPGFGYFDTYYLDERYSRGALLSKDQTLPDASMNGILGRLGFNLFDMLTLSGTYQYMTGTYKNGGDATAKYYEASAGIGEAVMNFVPVFNLAEAYVRNSNIGGYDKYGNDGNPEPGKKAGHFDRSPGLYLGYRAGIEIVAGLSIIGDYRYGWKEETDNLGAKKLVSDDHWQIHAAMRF